MSYSFNILILVIALMVLTIIVVTPILLVVFIARQIRKKSVRALFILSVAAAPFVLLFFTGFIGNSSARVERDHSISVPRSSSNIDCDGFVSLTTFEDASAAASFEISRNDLPTFLAQFKNLKTSSTPNDPLDTSPHPASEHPDQVIFNFDGMSRDGNVMHMDIYNVDASRVRVCIETCWN